MIRHEAIKSAIFGETKRKVVNKEPVGNSAKIVDDTLYVETMVNRYWIGLIRAQPEDVPELEIVFEDALASRHTIETTWIDLGGVKTYEQVMRTIPVENVRIYDPPKSVVNAIRDVMDRRVVFWLDTRDPLGSIALLFKNVGHKSAYEDLCELGVRGK